MKTPYFWYPRPGDQAALILAQMLSPLSGAFRLGTAMRLASARPYRPRVPLICVGNAVAGGAGKTPTALALMRILKGQGHKPVFVTRGYGGTGELVCIDRDNHSAAEVGDESLLLAAQAPTWVGRDRKRAVQLAEGCGTLMIMDDGLQNPHIIPSASVLVFDGEAGIGNGHVMPAGPLREPLEDALKRATCAVIIGERDRQQLAPRMSVPVFRARLQPRLPFGFPRVGNFIAFAGIARPEKFYTTARVLGLNIVQTCDFPDHHLFTAADIDTLRLKAEERGARLLTTEKDAVRLPPAIRDEVVVLPVSLIFDDPGAELRIAGLIAPEVGRRR